MAPAATFVRSIGIPSVMWRCIKNDMIIKAHAFRMVSMTAPKWWLLNFLPSLLTRSGYDFLALLDSDHAV